MGLRAESIPREVLAAAERLRASGGQAWIVGGAVRDLLLRAPVRDWDLATDLQPERIAALFPHTVAVGAQFGTVVVVGELGQYEITTFRRDFGYTDGRHPDAIAYADNPEEDLARRDFTVNAMAYDPLAGRLLDPHSGIADLEARILRAVGDPNLRFREDALRLLRGVRLSAQLGFSLEAATRAAIVRHAPGIERVSAERIAQEMERLLGSERAGAGLELLHETGLLRRILPELERCYGVPQNPFHAYDVFYHTLAAIDGATPDDRLVRWAALFHDLGKPETREETADSATFYSHQIRSERHAHRALGRLRFSTQDRETVAHLVRHHMFHYTPDWTDGAVRRFVRTVGRDRVALLYRLRAADTRGNGKRTRIAPELEELALRIARVLEADDALDVTDLAIDGHDLMAEFQRGPGRWIGALLRDLLEEVLEDPGLNTRETLLQRARARLAQSAETVQRGPKNSSGPKGSASSL